MTTASQTRSGITMGVGAYTVWGVLPLFFHALIPLSAPGILAHRVLWSLLIMGLLALALKRWPSAWAAIRRPRIALAMVASTLFIATNWLLYIWAVNSGHALQASLGYFMNPIVNVLLGVVILRERLGRPELAAVLLAACGVTALAIWQGGIPLIPLTLAISFGLYGLIRKMVPVGPVEGLLIETALLAPLSAVWLWTTPVLPAGAAGPPYWMLVATGFATSIPLLLFAGATKRLRYSELGLLQYIAPTLQFLIAITLFGEPLLPIHLIAFGLIWAGLAVYATATWRRGRGDAPIPD